MTDRHKVLFEWPHSEPTEVIVAGSFNDWTRTCRLTRGPNGFTGFIHVPWDSKISYKYIVDGTWITHSDQPTEPDHDGNINNIYIAPPQPQSESNSKTAPASGEVSDIATGSLPQLVADTVVAREGTSSTLAYVASGFGSALNSVVGVDPINPEQIAIPTPIQTVATTTTEPDAPGSAMSDNAPLPPNAVEVLSPFQPMSENPADSEDLKVVPTPEPPAKASSDASVSVVPVNTAENFMVPTPAVKSVIVKGDVWDTDRRRKDEQPEKSAHIPVKVDEGVPVHVEDETNRAVDTLVVGEPHAGMVKKPPATDSVLTEKVSKVMHVTAAAPVDEPSLVASADRVKDSKSLKTPETTTSSLNPSSMVVSEQNTTGTAPSTIPEAKARPQDMPVVPVERHEKDLNELEQTKSRLVVDEAKVGPVSISAPELSLEMSNAAAGPATAEVVPGLVREPQRNREKGEPIPVESAPFSKTILVSQTQQEAMEDGIEPSVVSVKQQEKEADAETKPGQPSSAPAQNTPLASESQSASVAMTGTAFVESTLASIDEIEPTDQVATLMTIATEPTPTPAAEVRPAGTFSASTIEAVSVEPVSVPTHAAPTVLAPASANEAAASIAPKAEAALSETSPEFVSVPHVLEPPAATFTPSNSHTKEVTCSAPVSPSTPAKAASPSTASPTSSPSKLEKMTPRKKTSSFFGRIKHLFKRNKVNL